MTDIPDVFAQNAGALDSIMTAVRRALDSDPDACRGQDDRLRAWCTATTQFCDAGFWAGALDAHRAAQRAADADAAHRKAATDAEVAQRAHSAARRDAAERTAQLNVTHPVPKL